MSRFFLIAVLAVFADATALAQAPAFPDTAVFYIGGSDFDIVIGVHELDGGDLIAALATRSTDIPTTSGAEQPQAAGDIDTYLIRFTRQGEMVWATYFGTEVLDVATAMKCVERLGICVVVGYTLGLLPGVTTGKTSEHNEDAFVYLFDPETGEQVSTWQSLDDEDSAFNAIDKCLGSDRLAAFGRSTISDADMDAFVAWIDAQPLPEFEFVVTTQTVDTDADDIFLDGACLPGGAFGVGVSDADPDGVLNGPFDGYGGLMTETLVPVLFSTPESDWFPFVARDENNALIGRHIEKDAATEILNAQPNFDEGSLPSLSKAAENRIWKALFAGDVNDAGLLCAASEVSTDGALEGTQIDFELPIRAATTGLVENLATVASSKNQFLLLVEDIDCTLFGSTVFGAGNTGAPGEIIVSSDPTRQSLDGVVLRVGLLQSAELYNLTDSPIDLMLTVIPQDLDPFTFNAALDAGESTGFLGFDGSVSWETGSSSGEVARDPGMLNQIFFGSDPFTLEVKNARNGGPVITNLLDEPVLVEWVFEDGRVIPALTINPEAAAAAMMDDLDAILKPDIRFTKASTGEKEIVRSGQSDNVVDLTEFRYVLHSRGSFGAAGKQTSQAFSITAFDIRGNPVDLKIVTATEESGQISESVALRDNYPNPFAETTEIPYSLSASMHVKLEVYTLLGRRVATLVDGMKTAGTFSAEWDGMLGDGRRAPAGMYLYRLSDGNGGMIGASRSMTLLR